MGRQRIRRLIALGVVLVVGLAGCSTNSEPTATYTGDGCDYDGPSEFDVNTTVTFTVINDSDTTNIGFSIWKFPSGMTAEELESGGIFETAGPEDDFTTANFPPTPIGEPEELRAFFDTAGQWGINCFESSGPGDDELGNDHITMFTVNG